MNPRARLVGAAFLYAALFAAVCAVIVGAHLARTAVTERLCAVASPLCPGAPR